MSGLFKMLATILYVVPVLRAQLYSIDDESFQLDSSHIKNVPSRWSSLWLGSQDDRGSYTEEKPLEGPAVPNDPEVGPPPNVLEKIGAHEPPERYEPLQRDDDVYKGEAVPRSYTVKPLVHRRGAGDHFNYARTEEWSVDHPDCGGRWQSPINLDSHVMARLEVPSLLTWTGYWNVPANMTLINNGHTAQMSGSWEKDKVPFISGGPLESEYSFAQLHFHWGPKDSVGSEHTVNNHSFPMEMHVVHYKKEYGSVDNALKYDDGLAVVAFFFEIGLGRNHAISLFKDALKRIEGVQNQVAVRPFPLAHFHLAFQGDYVAYLGSLTTPPCKEIVTWIVSSTPLTIRNEQMEMFRRIHSEAGDDHNYRPVQPLNDRMIYYISY